MAVPKELMAQPGDEIRTRYSQLTKWLDAQKLLSQDDRVHIHQTTNGQHVTLVQRPPSIVTPLQVNQSGANFYSVREGYVNGRLPLIQTVQGEKPLVDEDGVPHPAARLPTDRPILVVAEVTFTNAQNLEKVLITTKRPRELLRTGTADVSAAEGIKGHIPLAFTRSGQFIQFTLHNLQVRAFTDNGRPRVIYWPG
jgi:hypothetical protein